jgi:hypothetical protein
MRDYIVGLTWVLIILSVATGICFIVHTCVNKGHKTKELYIERGYVQVTMRYPSTFTESTIWVKEEDVETYVRINSGVQRASDEIKILVDGKIY